jgi:hypothetical protein
MLSHVPFPELQVPNAVQPPHIMAHAHHPTDPRCTQPFDALPIRQEHGLEPRTARHLFLRDVSADELRVLCVIHEVPVSVTNNGILGCRRDVPVDEPEVTVLCEEKEIFESGPRSVNELMYLPGQKLVPEILWHCIPINLVPPIQKISPILRTTVALQHQLALRSPVDPRWIVPPASALHHRDRSILTHDVSESATRILDSQSAPLPQGKIKRLTYEDRHPSVAIA